MKKWCRSIFASISIIETSSNFNVDLNIQENKRRNKIEGEYNHFCNFSNEQTGNVIRNVSKRTSFNWYYKKLDESEIYLSKFVSIIHLNICVFLSKINSFLTA